MVTEMCLFPYFSGGGGAFNTSAHYVTHETVTLYRLILDDMIYDSKTIDAYFNLGVTVLIAWHRCHHLNRELDGGYNNLGLLSNSIC